MPPQDVWLYLLQSRLPHCLIHGGGNQIFRPDAAVVAVPWSGKPLYDGTTTGTGPCGRSAPTSTTQIEELPVSPPWIRYPTPDIFAPSCPKILVSRAHWSHDFWRFSPPQVIHFLRLKEFLHGTWRMTQRWVGVHTPRNNDQYFPTSLQWLACAASIPPPLHIVRCWGGGHLRPPTAPPCCSIDTVGEGGWTPPKWSYFTSHADTGSVHGDPSLYLTSPYSPKLGIPTFHCIWKGNHICLRFSRGGSPTNIPSQLRVLSSGE